MHHDHDCFGWTINRGVVSRQLSTYPKFTPAPPELPDLFEGARMGAEVGVLSNYTLHAACFKQDNAHLWSLFSATAQDHSRPLSVFVHERSSAKEAKFAENCIKCIRLMRHPHIVKYVTSSCSPTTDLQLVVEFVQPVLTVSSDMHSMEVIAGLRGIVDALQFLHVKCQMSHNNVCALNIMVAGSDRSWRLSGFDLAGLFSAITVEFLKEIEPFREAEAIPPEDRQPSTGNLCSQCPHARDAWAFGSLILEFSDHLNGNGPGELEARLGDSLLSQSPEDRPTMKAQLSDSLLSNQLVKILLFIDSITLKSAKEKSAFFRSLPRRLQQVPPGLVARHLARKLLSRFVLMEETACRQVVPLLLTPKREGDNSGECSSLFNEDLFKTHIIPILVKLFAVEDKHVRLVLLHHLPSFSDQFTRSCLKEDILPQVLVGMHDCNDEIVATTFEALAHLVRVLGAEEVVGSSARVSHFTGVTPQSQSSNGQVFRNVSIATLGTPTPPSGSSASKSARQPCAKSQLQGTPIGASRLRAEEDSAEVFRAKELKGLTGANSLADLLVEEACVAESVPVRVTQGAQQAEDQTAAVGRRDDILAMGHHGRKDSSMTEQIDYSMATRQGNIAAGEDDDVIAEDDDDDDDWEGFDDSWTESNAGSSGVSLPAQNEHMSEMSSWPSASDRLWNCTANNERTVSNDSVKSKEPAARGMKLGVSEHSQKSQKEDTKQSFSAAASDQAAKLEEVTMSAEEALLAELEPTIQFDMSSPIPDKRLPAQDSTRAVVTPTKTAVSLEYDGTADGDAEGWGEDDFEDF